MNNSSIPQFIIFGSPNEEKLSLISTMTENDTLPINPIIDTNTKIKAIPLILNGKEIIRFFDIQGFQNPGLLLAWIKKYTGPSKVVSEAFVAEHKNDPKFNNDCELFTLVVKSTGIIYPIDGSHPVTDHVRAEMEILRLIGLPRMSLINCKNDDTDFSKSLKLELLKNFNAVRHLNACQASYAGRIGILECFNRIDEDWHQVELSRAIDNIKSDWNNRNKAISKMIRLLVEAALATNLSIKAQGEIFDGTEIKKLKLKFEKKIKAIEKVIYEKIKRLHKHTIFNFDALFDSILPEQILVDKIQQCDVTYSKKSTFIARVGSFFKPGRIRPSDYEQVKIGPIKDIQFLYILIDRAFLFYSCIINRSHGRRDDGLGMSIKTIQEVKNKYLTINWNENEKKICSDFLKSTRAYNRKKREKMRLNIQTLFQKSLNNISQIP